MVVRYRLLVVLLAIIGWGCVDVVTDQSVTGPVTVGSTPGPTVPPGVSCSVARVHVGPFGERPTCYAGGQLRVGCAVSITATPEDTAGNPLSPEVHGSAITWFDTCGGIASVGPLGAETFNRAVVGVGPGVCVVSATVCGVTGAWDVEVVP